MERKRDGLFYQSSFLSWPMISIETAATMRILDMVLYLYEGDGCPGTMRTGPSVTGDVITTGDTSP